MEHGSEHTRVRRHNRRCRPAIALPTAALERRSFGRGTLSFTLLSTLRLSSVKHCCTNCASADGNYGSTDLYAVLRPILFFLHYSFSSMEVGISQKRLCQTYIREERAKVKRTLLTGRHPSPLLRPDRQHQSRLPP